MLRRPPTSIIPGNPEHSLFNRIERRATGNPEFNLRVKQIAHFIGYVYEDEEIVYQPGQKPSGQSPTLEGTTIEKLGNLVKELEEGFKQQNTQGQSGVPASDQDTRTVDLTTGIITLGRDLRDGEEFNQFNGITYRKRTTNPPPETTKEEEDYLKV